MIEALENTMSQHSLEFLEIKTLREAEQQIRIIGSDPKSIEIMAPKAISKIIKVKNIALQDAIIIKQDMLSIGGEVAIPKNAFELKKDKADILIMGTVLQLHHLVQKLNRHYARIQATSKELSKLIQEIR